MGRSTLLLGALQAAERYLYMKPRIAIIGAGISGLHLATRMQDHAEITVFEKARGVSGRLSTRYADPFQFDHGAQYFTARTKSFQSFLKPYLQQGIVKPWTPKIVTLAKGEAPYKRDWFEPHYVAAPRMNHLCQILAAEVDVRLPVEIKHLERTDKGWHLEDKEAQTYGPFDWVISSAPAPQSATLLPGEFNGQEALSRIVMTGNYTVLIGLLTPLPWHWEAAVVKDSPIGWMAANHSKPDRASTSASLLVQSTNEWAEAHIDEDIPAMQSLLLKEVFALTGLDASAAPHLATHRWRYAHVENAAETPFLLDSERQLAVCGDGCLGGRVEAAWLSADGLASALRQTL